MLEKSVWYLSGTALLCIACAFAAAFALCRLFNAVPAKWFCDYGEEPGEELNGVRFAFKKEGIFIGFALSIGYAALIFVYGYSVYSLVAAVILTALVSICASDIKYTIIPDELTAVLAVTAVLGSIYDICNGKLFCSQWYHPILGGLFGGGVIFLINLLSRLLFKKDGIGFGDLKLFAAIGIFTGVPGIFIVIYLSIFVAFICFAFLIAAKRLKKGVYYPMGPYICIAAAIAIIFKEQLMSVINWYIGLLF